MKTQPIRRNRNMVTLSHDHHMGLLFCWKIRQGLKQQIEPRRIAGYAHYFWDKNLKSHFNDEEQFLFILPGNKKIKTAMQEHNQIRSLIKSIMTASPDPPQEQLATLADMVERHIRFEERELFPYLERRLSGEQLEDIGRSLAAGQHLPDLYPDEFWNRR